MKAIGNDAQLKKANVVPYEGGYMFSKSYPYDNGYTEEIGLMADEGIEFAFACKMTQHGMDIEQIIEELEAEGYENMDCEIPESLAQGVKDFNRINHKLLQSWSPDYSKKYRVPQPTPTE